MADNPWAGLPDDPPFVAGVDRLILDNDRQLRYGLHLEVMPVPWIGNPRSARALLLQLNPGYAPDRDPDDERSRPGYRPAVRRSLALSPDAGFWPLDPDLRGTSAADWWRRKLAPLIRELGPDGEALIRGHLAVAEYFPYHSIGYRWPPRLPSQDFGFRLIAESASRGALIVVMRSWELWRAAVPELIPLDPPRNEHFRQASVSRRNLGSTTFDALIASLTGRVADLDPPSAP